MIDVDDLMDFIGTVRARFKSAKESTHSIRDGLLSNGVLDDVKNAKLVGNADGYTMAEMDLNEVLAEFEYDKMIRARILEKNDGTNEM